jgi:general secretion pathway protein B
MSYILEALKKAQAERQIGSTPTIHAPTLASVPAGQGARSNRTPVIVAMALMAAAIAGLATMLVRQQPAASAPVAAAPAEGPAPANSSATPVAIASRPGGDAHSAPAAPAVTVAGAAPAAPAAAITASQAPARPGEAPPAQRALGQPAANQRAADARVVAAPPAARAAEAPQLPAQKQAGTAARAADVTRAVPVAAQPQAPVPAPAPAEEQVQSLRELPEPIQRAIPQITLGGYMYSKNPADRLLLIDKVLRREGEEVAPGLILDKLQPKQAIFSFRGYRYRVPL